MILITCRDCKQEKPTQDMCPDVRGDYGVKKLCKSCAAIRAKKYRKEKPEKYKKHRNDARVNRRKKILNALGNKCIVCGESRYEFLTIDHILNDGAQHRKELYGNSRKGGDDLYVEIIKLGIPKDRFQILCYNCNCSKGFYGYNPKQLEQQTILLTEGFLGEGI